MLLITLTVVVAKLVTTVVRGGFISKKIDKDEIPKIVLLHDFGRGEQRFY